MRQLIYLYPDTAAFIRKDVEILSRHFEVLSFELNWKKNSQIPINLLKQAIFLLRHLKRSEAVFVMFGGYWSLFPSLLGKLFGRPVFIILGGADCVSFPEYNYGSLRKPFLKFIIGLSYKLCTRLLPVDGSLIANEYTYDPEIRQRKQGYLNFFPALKTPYTVIYNGFDPDSLNPEGIEKDENLFITIAKVDDIVRMRIKGIDLVIELAKRIPDHKFVVIGMDKSFTETLGVIPDNIIIHSFLSFNEFRSILLKSRYYLQLSISEGFPNALCEGMLCECIPIGSRVGATASIVGDDRLIADRKDVAEIEKMIRKIISYSTSDKNALGKNARKRILDNFTLQLREKALIDTIKQYRHWEL
jgi:glycosyltransferase involved in cell wall biosynthesis